MATDRNKIIENYCLEELKYYNPDESEIWVAKHKVLKKNFTLKRVKFRGTQGEGRKDQEGSLGKQQWDYNNIVRETNILKRLMCEMCPKCHKMIKTSNNVYVVYDQFPETSVKEYLVKHALNRYEKLSLMLQIAKAVNYFHTRAIILLYLSTTNIYVKEKNGIFFSDWALARTVETQDKINSLFLNNKYESLPKQLLDGEKYSYWSDIYCLGTVFQKIFRSGMLEEPSQIDKKVDQLITKMLNDRGHQRPRLEEILRHLQNFGADDMSEKSRSPSNSEKNVKSLKSISNFKIKHTISTPVDSDQLLKNTSILQSERKYSYLLTPRVPKDQCPSPLFSKSVRSAKCESKASDLVSIATSRKIDSKKSFQITSTTSMNYTRKKKEEERIAPFQLMKIANKKRNLAFFILQLSEFILRVWLCPQLGYILLKYSLLTMNSAIEQWQKYDNIPAAEREEVISILISQKLKIASNLAFLRDNLQIEVSDMNLKRQFQLQNQISDKYLKEKIIEFGKEMVMYCETNLNQKSALQKLIDCLFKTYMILKKVEQGTYQKFWDKVYSKDYAFLHSQKYMKQERHLGHRYLKSRIAEILRGK